MALNSSMKSDDAAYFPTFRAIKALNRVGESANSTPSRAVETVKTFP